MSTNSSILEPAGNLTREIGLMVAALEEVRAQTIGVLADMTAEELAVRYAPSFHQIGGLALHLAETQYWWIQTVFAKKEITEEDRRAAHLDNTVEEDFALKGYNSERCIEVLSTMHQRMIETLSPCSDEDLDKLMELSPHPTRKQGTLRWILHHLIDHEAHHKGQIAMIKRLIREG